MRVLVTPSDRGFGTSFYRASIPFNRLPIEVVNLSGEFSWETLAGIDVCYIQRPATPLEVLCISEAKKFNCPVLLDYDDDPTSLNKENPVYNIWNRDDKQACVREALKLADITMVSTPHLREALLEEVPLADIRVVPNAQDDLLFSFSPYKGPREKIIAMRGGSSHELDWGIYKEGILEILRQNPDWKLQVMGYHPQWMSTIPDSQLSLYEFCDIPTYFTDLMLLRPQVAIVPLADNKFNRSKSNIGWQEFTMAGAAVLASDLPEFRVPGITITSPKDLVDDFSWVVANSQKLYESSLRHVPKLSEVNEKRLDILEELRTRRKKYTPNQQPKTTATALEFHNHSLAYGNTQDNDGYQKLHSKTAEWIVNTLNPKTALELGAGTGGTLLELLKRGVMAYGLEYNPHSVQYFKDNYPMYERQILEADITKETIENDGIGDLIYSFETFEHLDVTDEWFEQFLLDLSKKFKYFYFSSTPYYKNEVWDHWWGHVGVRKTSSWKALFEKSGWKFVSNPKILVGWDLLFVSSSVIS